MRGAGCRKRWPGWGAEETEEQRREAWKGQIRTLNRNSGKGQWEGDLKGEEQEEEKQAREVTGRRLRGNLRPPGHESVALSHGASLTPPGKPHRLGLAPAHFRAGGN